MKNPTYDIEGRLVDAGYVYVVGVDEVGRGAAAGPVVACAVYIPPEQVPHFLFRVKDSKKLSEKKRELLAEEIKERCDVGIGFVDNLVIDRINILQATIQAMSFAVNKVKYVDYIIADGNMNLDVCGYPYSSIINGDNLSLSIAAASIVAKVYRDDLMRTLHWVYPEYGWLKNKGYLTKEHQEAIKLYGLTDLHRKSFCRGLDKYI